MKWFKHDTAALKDEKIQEIIHKHGFVAYGVFFVICELVGEKIKEGKMEPTISIQWTYIEHLTRTHRSTVRRVLDGCATVGLLVNKSTNSQMICYLPKLLLRLDNWTKRSVSTTEILRSNYPLNKNKKKNIEEEVYTSTFLDFWALYPKKDGKKLAFESWQKIKPDVKLVKCMLEAIESSRQRKDWLKENGQFIPMAVTWLNQRRWEDEPTSIKSVADSIRDGDYEEQ